MADITQIESAIGIDKFPPVKVSTDDVQPVTRTFRRTCQHYITNNNASSAPVVSQITNADGPVLANFASYYYVALEQGYYNIPYSSTAMAMDIADWDTITLGARMYRFKGCGFSIRRITCSQQQVSTVGASTTVTNQFTQAPCLMLVKDNSHELSSVATINNPTTTPPSVCSSIALTPGQANKSFPHSFAAGQLPNVWFLQPSGPGTTFQPETSFDIMKGGDVELLSTSDTYSYNWECKDHDRWLSPFVIGNGEVLNDESVRQTAQYDPTHGASLVAPILQNLATNVNRNLLDIPVTHLVRVPPLYTQLSAVTVTLELWIEYHMTVEWIPGRYLTTRYIGGNDVSCLAGNMLPFGTYRRNMLALAATNQPPPTKKKRLVEETTTPKKVAARAEVPVPVPETPRRVPHGRQAVRFVDVEDEED